MLPDIVRCPLGVRIILVLDHVFFAPFGSLLFSLDFSSWQFLLVCCFVLEGSFHFVLRFLIFLWSSAFTYKLLHVACETFPQFWLLFHSELDSSIWGRGKEVLPIGNLISGWSGFRTVQNLFPFFLLNVSGTMWVLLLLVFGPDCSYFGVHEW